MSDRDTHLRLAEADTTANEPGTFTVNAKTVRHAIGVLKGYFNRNAYEIGTFQPTDIPTKAELDAHKHCVAAARLSARDSTFLSEQYDWKRNLRPPTGENEPNGLGDMAAHVAIKLTNCQRGIYPGRPKPDQSPNSNGDLALELGRPVTLDRGIEAEKPGPDRLRLAEAEITPNAPGTKTLTTETLQHAIDMLDGYFRRHAYEMGTFQPTPALAAAEEDALKLCIMAARLNTDGKLFNGAQVRDAWKKGMQHAQGKTGLVDAAVEYATKCTNSQRGIYPNGSQAGRDHKGEFALRLARLAELERTLD